MIDKLALAYILMLPLKEASTFEAQVHILAPLAKSNILKSLFEK
jgi:hypothetical protein